MKGVKQNSTQENKVDVKNRETKSAYRPTPFPVLTATVDHYQTGFKNSHVTWGAWCRRKVGEGTTRL